MLFLLQHVRINVDQWGQKHVNPSTIGIGKHAILSQVIVATATIVEVENKCRVSTRGTNHATCPKFGKEIWVAETISEVTQEKVWKHAIRPALMITDARSLFSIDTTAILWVKAAQRQNNHIKTFITEARIIVKHASGTTNARCKLL